MVHPVQRWRERRDSYRRPDEQIKTSRYDVVEIADDTTAKTFVKTHHYSGSYPAARFRFGLYRSGALVGVSVFSVPMRKAVLTKVFPGDASDSVELGRFVLTDDVEGNGETWFLARCFEQLKAKELRGVVSFSDPMPRQAADGRQMFAGHLGIIYQAHNGRYLGRATRRTLRLLPDARVFSARAESKIRKGEKGWRYSAALLQAFGAPSCPTSDAARRAWLKTWIAQLTRSVRHPGNHRYAWPLHRRAGMIGTPEAYPKSPLTLF